MVDPRNPSLKLLAILTLLGSSLLFQPRASAQDAPPTGPPATESEQDPELASEQLATTARYERFEKSLLQLFEYMRKTDPDRADLLERAYRQSREDQIASQMRSLVNLLQQEEFGDAVDQQEELMAHLGSLLDLLQSEDRMSELEKEKARIEALIKDVNRAIGREKVVRAETEKQGDLDRIAQKQGDVADETQGIVDKIRQQDGDAKSGESSAGKPADGKPQDGDQKPGDEKEPGEPKAGEKKPGEKEPGEPKSGSESKPSEGMPSEGMPSEGMPSEGMPGEGKPGESKQQQQKQQQQSKQNNTPGREELEKAKQEMEKAIEELKKKNAENASEHQDKALEELIAAKEKLEEILNQLREEERRLMLAALEARFQKMLNLQVIVLNGTINLSKTPEREREASRFTGKSRELSLMEDEIAIEAEKALVLLKTEGTSVAFPIAVEDLLTDIRTVSTRLEDVRVDDLTQAIERDIVEALQEMVEALQKEMEKDSQSQESPPSDSQGDPVLVDKLAELKMLRTLQKRVNRRTRTLGQLIDGEQADDSDVLGQLRELAKRQSRIVRTAYEINNTRTDP